MMLSKKSSDYVILGILKGNGARNRGDIDSHPAMRQAYEMGKKV